MELAVDKRDFLKKLKWVQRVSPNAEKYTIATKDDALVFQPEFVDNTFHQAESLADVLEHGVCALPFSSIKSLEGLKGQTLTLESEEDMLTFSTENETLSIESESSSLSPLPDYETIGTINGNTFQKALLPIKECVGKKSEKGNENLLEGLLVIDGTTVRLYATNRLVLASTTITHEGEPLERLESTFVPLQWAGTAEELSDRSELIRNKNSLGLKDDTMFSLFPLGGTNDIVKLIPILKELAQEEVSTVTITKKNVMDALTSLKKQGLYGRMVFENDNKIAISSLSKIQGEQVKQKLSFSIDYEGDSSVESIVVDPNNLMKIVKNVKGREIRMLVPKDKRSPISVSDAALSSPREAFGLAMTVQR